jgi:hypothetical protein
MSSLRGSEHPRIRQLAVRGPDSLVVDAPMRAAHVRLASRRCGPARITDRTDGPLPLAWCMRAVHRRDGKAVARHA